ncbi:hypothetical protein D3C76_1152500 [compost metagenome]
MAVLVKVLALTRATRCRRAEQLDIDGRQAQQVAVRVAMPRGDQGAGIEQQVTARCLHALAGQETLEVQQETRHNIAAKRIANHHFRIDSDGYLTFILVPLLGPRVQ